MVFSLKRCAVIASAGLGLALSACGVQDSSLQPTMTPPATPTACVPVAAPTQIVTQDPGAPANYPAPPSGVEPCAQAAYPGPTSGPDSSAPTAYPAPLAMTTIPALPTTVPGPTPAPEKAGSCLPPGEPGALAGPAYPAPPISHTLQLSHTLQSAIPRYSYRVVNTYPHDRGAFTEGLQYVDGALYEGTGLNGKSELRRVALESGEVQQRCRLPEGFFGEGVTVLGDTIYQLTWQNYVGFVYDKASFTWQRSFTYPTEGWGLTHDDRRLIMSDGTATIHFLDAATLAETGHIDVYDDHGPVVRLNELEYVRGEIYANVWQTDQIARIDPQSGQVLGWIDLSGLLSAEDRRQPVNVLNGIAYDAAQNRLFVTGKLWPKLFQIELVPVG